MVGDRGGESGLDCAQNADVSLGPGNFYPNWDAYTARQAIKGPSNYSNSNDI